MNTETPISDAAAYIPGMTSASMVVRLDVSRELERKLNEANETLASLTHAVAGKCPKHGTVTVFGHLSRTGCDEWHCPACEEIADLERKLAICRAALGIRDHEKIPDQRPTAGSLLVDEGSIRRRVYADGAELAKATALLTRARNGPGVTLPYELYEDIQEFLNEP